MAELPSEVRLDNEERDVLLPVLESLLLPLLLRLVPLVMEDPPDATPPASTCSSGKAAFAACPSRLLSSPEEARRVRVRAFMVKHAADNGLVGTESSCKQLSSYAALHH